MLVGDDDIVSWRKPFNTPLGSFHTCCRRQPTKATLRLHFENVELRHGVAVTKKQWVDTDIESQARLAVHKMRVPHPFAFGGWRSIRAKALSRQTSSPQCFEAPLGSQRGGGPKL